MQLGLQLTDPYRRQEKDQPAYNAVRHTHTWVLGKSGTGKSTALVRWAIDDILSGEGIAFFDPHGDAIAELLQHIPRSRHRDVILFDPSDPYPIGFNVLGTIPQERRPFVASSVVDCFRSIWEHSWGPQLEQFLYNGTAALLDMPDGTLLGLKFIITSKKYRTRVLSHVLDPLIKDFWETDFEVHMPDREKRERTLSTLNKIGALIADPAIRNIIGQNRMALDLKDIMDTKKILLVSLGQGQLGLLKSRLIGSLILSQLHLTALGRTNRMPFHVYMDEFHHFGGPTLIEMLSGIRKFGITLVCAHQYVSQLSPELREAMLGTVGTTVAFRLGATDAELLAPEFGLGRDDDPLPQLRAHQAYARTDGRTWSLSMPPTGATTYPKAPQAIRNWSREKYGTPREEVEERIRRFVAHCA